MGGAGEKEEEVAWERKREREGGRGKQCLKHQEKDTDGGEDQEKRPQRVKGTKGWMVFEVSVVINVKCQIRALGKVVYHRHLAQFKRVFKFLQQIFKVSGWKEITGVTPPRRHSRATGHSFYSGKTGNSPFRTH